MLILWYLFAVFSSLQSYELLNLFPACAFCWGQGEGGKESEVIENNQEEALVLLVY